MENKMLALILSGFIFLLISFTFINAIASDTNRITTAQTATNESFSGKLNVATALTNANITAVSAIRNATGSTVPATNYTLNATPGTITMLAPQVNNTYYADYTYNHPDYVSDGTTRTIATTIIIFAAIGALAVALMVAFPSIRDIFNF